MFNFLNLVLLYVLKVSFFFFFLSSCQSKPHLDNGRDNSQSLSQSTLSRKDVLSRHSKLIRMSTRKKEKNKGLYNLFKVWITPIHSEILESLLDREALFFQWNQEELNERKMKLHQEASFQSKVVISLFTSKRSFNRFSVGKQSIWRVYLEFEGVRYVGKVKKVHRSDSELRALFSHHSRFSSFYEAYFDIPMTKIEKGTFWIVLTSHLGSVKVAFEPFNRE